MIPFAFTFGSRLRSRLLIRTLVPLLYITTSPRLPPLTHTVCSLRTRRVRRFTFCILPRDLSRHTHSYVAFAGTRLRYPLLVVRGCCLIYCVGRCWFPLVLWTLPHTHCRRFTGRTFTRHLLHTTTSHVRPRWLFGSGYRWFTFCSGLFTFWFARYCVYLTFDFPFVPVYSARFGWFTGCWLFDTCLVHTPLPFTVMVGLCVTHVCVTHHTVYGLRCGWLFTRCYTRHRFCYLRLRTVHTHVYTHYVTTRLPVTHLVRYYTRLSLPLTNAPFTLHVRLLHLSLLHTAWFYLHHGYTHTLPTPPTTFYRLDLGCYTLPFYHTAGLRFHVLHARLRFAYCRFTLLHAPSPHMV